MTFNWANILPMSVFWLGVMHPSVHVGIWLYYRSSFTSKLIQKNEKMVFSIRTFI